MVNLNNLPDAWEIINKLDGEESNEKDRLYDIYYLWKVSQKLGFKLNVTFEETDEKIELVEQ